MRKEEVLEQFWDSTFKDHIWELMMESVDDAIEYTVYFVPVIAPELFREFTDDSTITPDEVVSYCTRRAMHMIITYRRHYLPALERVVEESEDPFVREDFRVALSTLGNLEGGMRDEKRSSCCRSSPSLEWDEPSP